MLVAEFLQIIILDSILLLDRLFVLFPSRLLLILRNDKLLDLLLEVLLAQNLALAEVRLYP